MNHEIVKVQIAIEPYRQQLIHHKVYRAIDGMDDLKIFMQHHVFAVWDYLSLVKALQRTVSVSAGPWYPKGSADTRYLVNEIVLKEESGIDGMGVRKSHFEMYIDAMWQAGASTRQANRFITEVRKGMDLEEVFAVANLGKTLQRFLRFTFKSIASKQDHVIASVFAFGRENLFPRMFYSLINNLDAREPGSISAFKYFVERLIEKRSEHHNQLSLQMVADFCGINEIRWQQAEAAAVEALQKHIQLLDGVYDDIIKQKEKKQLACCTA